MKLWTIMAFLLLVMAAANVPAGELTVVLDVTIDPAARHLKGIAHISGGSGDKLRLDTGGLTSITVNNRDIQPEADGSILVPAGGGRPVVVRYRATVESPGRRPAGGYIDARNIFLMSDWYPAPRERARYTLSVTLPRDFEAVSEADSVSIAYAEDLATHLFHFDEPLDSLHLAASSNYVVKKAEHNGIAIETYFFREDAALADTYIDYTRQYLDLYQSLLTPYPYDRFAIVENILPTGLALPTFTLLGREVVRLPFIVKTSLAHELLHQWFGSHVRIDAAHGNWAEGLATYLADYLLEEKQGRGRDYRKQILVNYGAYVNKGNALPLSRFQYRSSRAEGAVGYGRAAMFLHGLRKRFGDAVFYGALKDFIRTNRLKSAAWHDLQASFERITHEDLGAYFDARINRAEIPALLVTQSSLEISDGAAVLSFSLRQAGEPFLLDIPVQVHTETISTTRVVRMDRQEQAFTLALESLPTRIVLDEEYDLMRQLTAAETPPVLAGIMGRKKVTLVVDRQQEALYRPLVQALGVGEISLAFPDDITFADLKNNVLVIGGHDNPLSRTLLGTQAPSDAGLDLEVFKHPYNDAHSMLLVHAGNPEEVMAVQRKLRHYGKYSRVAFDQGKVVLKETKASQNGLTVSQHPATLALRPGLDPTLGQILDTLQTRRVIFVGEKHDRYAHHMNQLEIIRHLHAAGAKVAVGMEMFHQPFQPAIDGYLAGRIDEREFLAKSRYFHEWRYDFGLYKPIVDFIKQNNIPLLALNIPGEVSRQVARQGLASLGAAQKAWVPGDLDFSNTVYRNELKAVFGQHGSQTGIDNFDYFLQAQILWDESMAARAARFLATHPGHTLVILAGNGHIRFGHGIPQRLFRRSGEPHFIIVQDEEMQAGVADHVLLTAAVNGRSAPKLGVMVEEKEGALTIAGISSKSPAEKAGLEKGDIVRALDGHPVNGLADLKLALYYCRPDQATTIQVMRGEQLLEKGITLFEFNSFSPHMKK